MTKIQINTILFKIHRWTGLSIALFIILVGLTGSLLVFLDEIDENLNPQIKTVEMGKQKVLLDKMIGSVLEKAPNATIRRVKINPDLKRAYEFRLINNHENYLAQVNPYTGKLLDLCPNDSYFISFIYSLHTSLLFPPWGDLIVAILALLFTISSLTGLWVQRKFLFKVFKIGIRKNRNVKTTNSDTHKLIGSIALLTNLIFGGTGIYISLYAYDLKFLTEQKQEPQKLIYDVSYRLDNLIFDAQKRIDGFEALFVSFPKSNTDNWVIRGKVPFGNALYAPKYSNASVEYSFSDGQYKKAFDMRTADFGEQLRDFGYEFHFGKYGGLPIKILYFIGGLLPAILSITGLIIWQKKSSKHI